MGVCYGQTDLPLAEPVAGVAATLRRQLPTGLPLYSSPLRRCRDLAVALHSSPRLDARLQEMHFGSWEMQAWEDIGRDALDAWAADPLHFAPPDGESAAQMMQRVSEFFTELTSDTVVVTHAGVIKALAGWVQALPHNEWIQCSFSFGSLTVLDSDERHHFRHTRRH